MRRRMIVVSKQADHDADLFDAWRYWYGERVRADHVIVTPVRTPLSSVCRTVDYYTAAGFDVRPIDATAGWNDSEIWRAQLDAVDSVIRAREPYVAISADADQFFEPFLEIGGPDETATFRRLQVAVSGGHLLALPDVNTYVGGFRGSAALDRAQVALTGHTYPTEHTVGVEYHLHLRGLVAFLAKVAALYMDPAGSSGEATHWRSWLAMDRAALVSTYDDLLDEYGPLTVLQHGFRELVARFWDEMRSRVC